MGYCSKTSEAEKSSRRVCIVVLGMHRSGTSALARVLNLLGCDLPKTLLGAHKSNQTGHWESVPISQLDERILDSAGSKWNDWLEFYPGWLQSPKAEEFREEALAILQEEFGSSRLFVLKDPRICRLVPFWLGVLEQAGVRPLIVCPVRKPLEVAASLEARDGFPIGLGQLLWLRHVLDAEFASRGTARFFTSYNRLISGWARITTEAQATLGVSWPLMADQVAVQIEHFLSNDYRHHQVAVETVLENPTLPYWLRGTFEILNNWATAGGKSEDFAVLDRIRAEFNTAAPAFSRLLAAEQDKIQRLESKLDTERRRVGEAEQQIACLKRALETRTHAAEEGAIARHNPNNALARRGNEAEETCSECAGARAELQGTVAARAQAENTATEVKEDIRD